MKKVAGLCKQMGPHLTIFFDGCLKKKLIPECQRMGFFIFRLTACVRNKIRLQTLSEEAVPRAGRVFILSLILDC